MRALVDMDTIQIEICTACINSCSNCTRFCGHKPAWFISEDAFKRAVDSMVQYPKMTGIMGGEPLLHPQFEELCQYALSKIPKQQLGLWTSLPAGYEHYRETICETFEHIFVNDHTRDDIYHHPFLVAIDEVFQEDERKEMWYSIDRCWAQMSWSASINPHGAFFCEIAASLSMLLDMNGGWPVEPGWWWRTTKDFREQIEQYCPMCGGSIPLKRRVSTEGVDDISPRNLERIKNFSKKAASGNCKVHDLKLVHPEEQEQLAAYKDQWWRNRVSQRYGIYQSLNEQRFLTPYLLKNWGRDER